MVLLEVDNWSPSAAERVFATTELLEHILTFLLGQLLLLTDQEDPRSVRVHGNARVLKHLLRCTEVSRGWRLCILGSNRLQRALFLLPDHNTERSWDRPLEPNRARRGLLGNHYMAPSHRAPQLNTIIQTTFPIYYFRFWHLNQDKHCAYMIITRRDIPAVHLRMLTGQGKSINDMLLSQPPCTALRAMIWEERDETRDYVDKTTSLKDSVLRCEGGLTLGMVHERVYEMFEQHPDVTAIKLTTV